MRPALALAADGLRIGSVEVLALDVFGTGNRTYFAASAGAAVVIDPPRDAAFLTAVAKERGWTVTHVLETHVHNDYVSGGRLLAQEWGAEYVVPVNSGVLCSALSLADEDQFEFGDATIRALFTPGHTPHHTTYVFGVAGNDLAVFSGGGLLFGGVGRTDLLGLDCALMLARAQWNSARRLPTMVGLSARLMPTHGFGSFCSAGGPVPLDRSLGGIQATNDVFAVEQEQFVTTLVGSNGPYPTYFGHMAAINVHGTPSVEPAPPSRCCPADLRVLAEDGAWVIDVRDRQQYDDGHLSCSISIDLAGSFATYLGWLVPWGAPVHLVVEGPAQLARATEELARIGYDQVVSYCLAGEIEPSDLRCQPREMVDGLIAARAASPALRVLDVRLPSEWKAGHVAGALHVPVHELLGRLDEIASWVQDVPEGTESRVWAYCGTGFRSALAASLLRRAGITAVHVDGPVVDALLAECSEEQQ